MGEVVVGGCDEVEDEDVGEDVADGDGPGVVGDAVGDAVGVGLGVGVLAGEFIGVSDVRGMVDDGGTGVEVSTSKATCGRDSAHPARATRARISAVERPKEDGFIRGAL